MQDWIRRSYWAYNRLPLSDGLRQQVNRVTRRLFLGYRGWINSRMYRAPAGAFKVIQVSPRSVEHLARLFGRPDLGLIAGGDWDLELRKIEDSPKFLGLRARFHDGADWEETGLFDHFLARCRRAGEFDFRAVEEQFRRRCELDDELFESIRRHGFKDHAQLADKPREEVIWDYVTVNIGRDGRLLFNGKGWHRLCIAKLLDIPSIPVHVLVRHAQWQHIRDEVARTHDAGAIGLDHPDLQDL